MGGLQIGPDEDAVVELGGTHGAANHGHTAQVRVREAGPVQVDSADVLEG